MLFRCTHHISFIGPQESIHVGNCNIALSARKRKSDGEIRPCGSQQTLQLHSSRVLEELSGRSVEPVSEFPQQFRQISATAPKRFRILAITRGRQSPDTTRLFDDSNDTDTRIPNLASLLRSTARRRHSHVKSHSIYTTAEFVCRIVSSTKLVPILEQHKKSLCIWVAIAVNIICSNDVEFNFTDDRCVDPVYMLQPNL